MYHVTKIIKNKKLSRNGFTLVELLVAIAIIGSISMVGVKMLYDIVSINAKQQTIEDSSDNFRMVARMITKAVVEAQSIKVPGPNQIELSKEGVCQSFQYNPDNLAILHSASCPFDAGNSSQITTSELKINNFSISSEENFKVITVEMEGIFKNALGDHPVSYKTTITPRI